jgi:signal transduction histidine kinase
MRGPRDKPIEVTVSRKDTKGVLTVRDHGRGVRPADRKRIFQRFERAADARQSSGLGLGLFISRQIVEAHGGRIGLEDARGEGACFVVELPFRISLSDIVQAERERGAETLRKVNEREAPAVH